MARDACQKIDACQARGTGHCRQCAALRLNTDPELLARRKEGIVRRSSNPQWRAAQAERARKLSERNRNDPVEREKRIARGRIAVKALQTPEARAKVAAAKPAGQQRRRARELAWCPEADRPEYLRLMRVYRAKEAKRMMLELFAARDARKTPLERQIERARKFGTFERPTAPANDPSYTLGGVSSYGL